MSAQTEGVGRWLFVEGLCAGAVALGLKLRNQCFRFALRSYAFLYASFGELAQIPTGLKAPNPWYPKNIRRESVNSEPPNTLGVQGLGLESPNAALKPENATQKALSIIQ